MQYNPHIHFVNDMVGKRVLYKKHGKDLLKALSKKIKKHSIYGWNIRLDVSEHYKCFTDNWMKEKYEYRVKEWWPLENGCLIVILEEDSGVGDHSARNEIFKCLSI